MTKHIIKDVFIFKKAELATNIRRFASSNRPAKKYVVPGMALKELIVAMENGLSPKSGTEFYNMAIAKHTILAVKEILDEGNSISDIDTELPSFYQE